MRRVRGFDADVLEQARFAAGVSRAELARELGVSLAAVKSWETGGECRVPRRW